MRSLLDPDQRAAGAAGGGRDQCPGVLPPSACSGRRWSCIFPARPLIFSSNVIGLFGLAAAAGALAAPLVGGSADKRNPRIAIGYGLGLLFLSFILFYVWADSITGMIAGIVLLDLAMQCIHVSNQSRVYALIPGARNRLNTVYMTVSFIGTSPGIGDRALRLGQGRLDRGLYNGRGA